MFVIALRSVPIYSVIRITDARRVVAVTTRARGAGTGRRLCRISCAPKCLAARLANVNDSGRNRRPRTVRKINTVAAKWYPNGVLELGGIRFFFFRSRSTNARNENIRPERKSENGPVRCSNVPPTPKWTLTVPSYRRVPFGRWLVNTHTPAST